MNESIRRMLKDVDRANAMFPPEILQREIDKALADQREAMGSLGAYRQFKMPPLTSNLGIDPSLLEGLADTRQQAFRAAFGGLKELPRTGIQRAVANMQNAVPAEGLRGALLDPEITRGITESIHQNGFQRALSSAQSLLRTPGVQGMFADMEPVWELLEQTEAMEDDAGDVQERLPETLDEEALLSLDIHTLVLVIGYFNSVFTALTAVLIVGTYGEEQSQALTNG